MNSRAAHEDGSGHPQKPIQEEDTPMPTDLLERPTALRPFGLTTAVPIRPVSVPLPKLTLCPERQISVTSEGKPFIFEPSLKTALTTTAQTTEDSQLDTETENDTD